jgi:flagellar hook-associated protein 2
MSGGFNVGGLITGLDSNSLIEQLIQLERQPILRIQERIAGLEAQRTAVTDVRTQLQSLRTLSQDFRFNSIFEQFESPSSDESVLTATVEGTAPVVGSYDIDVTQLASATLASSSGVLGSAINPNAPLDSSGISTAVTAGDFTINGQTFTIDPTTQSLNQVLGIINASSAGVVATYDAVTDAVTFENATPGDTSIINFGAGDDDSNFLDAIGVNEATQSTGTNGSTVAMSTRNLGAIDAGSLLSAASFAGGAATSGSFFINGVQINVDVNTETVSSILGAINDSDAGVTASYDTANDTIRVVSDTLGSRTVSFISGTSNFLDMTNLTTAVQEAGNDAQFTLNGGSVQTRNTNEISDAIGGVVLSFQSVGTSTVTVSTDDEAIVESVQEFIDEFNASFSILHEQTQSGAAAENDLSLRIIQNFLQSTIFSDVAGLGGEHNNMLDIGISSGDVFDSEGIFQLQLDEDSFLEALRDDRGGVEQIFSNTDQTGVGDLFEDYLEDATSFQGFLNERIRGGGIIDDQIESFNTRIDNLERRVAATEARLRRQFSRLEVLSSTYQQQSAALSGLSIGF